MTAHPGTTGGAAATRDDRLLDGRLLLRQPVRGHRAGTDAVLLAAAAQAGPGDVVDLGAGVGTVGLAVAVRHPGSHVRLVERDPAAAALARYNASANGLEARVEVVEVDVFASSAVREEAGLGPRSADLVLTNPPFDAPGRVRPSPDPARRAAHVMGDGGLDGWIRTTLDVLRPGGTLVVIHRATALPALLASLDRRFGGVCVRPVAAKAGEAASRVLVRAEKGSRAPFALLPPLVLHDDTGGFTPQAEALHRGEAALPWA
ncbi:tRNA1(Val) (adenine(37)-N6)-methyltransferase [Alsobacter sp. R-9]